MSEPSSDYSAVLDLAGRLDSPGVPRYAGATKTGFLLPNGWVVSPVGEQVPVADLPLNILPLPDSRHVLVATSGYNAHELSLIDLGKRAVVDRQAVRESWFGVMASPRFDRIWWWRTTPITSPARSAWSSAPTPSGSTSTARSTVR